MRSSAISCAAIGPLSRRARMREGRLSPYKLRCTTAISRPILAQGLSLAQLAAVSQTSPAHFARLFKQATRLSPHQYVLARRMACAKQLLTETDVPLSEIGSPSGVCGIRVTSARSFGHTAASPPEPTATQHGLLSEGLPSCHATRRPPHRARFENGR